MSSPRRQFLLGLLVTIGVIGCADKNWDWETGKWYAKEDATPADRRRVSPASADRSARSGRARPSPEADVDPLPPGDDVKAYHRLYLLSGEEADASEEQDPSDRTGMLLVHTRRATGRQVGTLLNELVPPVGAGGTEHRYYLVYQSADSLRLARDLVADMDKDVQGVETGARISPEDAFRSAILLHYELQQRRYDPALATELVRRLNLAAAAEKLPARVRWASCMLAATIHRDQLADANARELALITAAGLVPADSMGAFLARAAQVRCLQEQGQPDQARDLAKRVVVDHQSYDATFTYQECLRLARQ